MAEHVTITPAGQRIVFEDGEPDPETGKKRRRSYTVDGEKLISVTTVCGSLDKPGLMWASEKLAVAGCIELAKQGELPRTVQGALSRLNARGLRFRQVWDAKADAGKLGHSDLVALCRGEEPGDLAEMSESERRIVRAVAGWAADNDPRFEEFEVPVCAPDLGFAGRHDFYGVLPKVHPTLKCLVDLKTTEELKRDQHGNVKPPYDENLIQLGLYEIARRASGYEPSDYQAVLRIDESGASDLFTTVVDLDVPLAVVNCYRALKCLPSKPSAPVAAEPEQQTLGAAK